MLEKALHRTARLEVGFEYIPEAVEPDMVLQQPNQPNRTLPSGTNIIDAFDEVNGQLLILGEPGSARQ